MKITNILIVNIKTNLKIIVSNLLIFIKIFNFYSIKIIIWLNINRLGSK